MENRLSRSYGFDLIKQKSTKIDIDKSVKSLETAAGPVNAIAIHWRDQRYRTNFPKMLLRHVLSLRHVFVTKVTKRAAMPAHFVTNEVVTNRAGIALFPPPPPLGYQYM